MPHTREVPALDAEALRCLVYRSTGLVTRREFQASGAVGRFAERNARLGLTGHLHMEDGSFYQALEGGAAALEEVWRDIQADPRHTAVCLLGDGPAAERRFAGWSMGYSDEGIHSLFDWAARSPLPLNGPRGDAVVLAFLEFVARPAGRRGAAL